MDIEVLPVLRRYNVMREMSDERAADALRIDRALPIERYTQELLVDAVRALRGNVTAYDGAYVALAPLLRCPLLTADRRLSRAVESIRVSVEIIS